MKKGLILLSILVLTLTLVLLAGCSGEAKEPAPAWPERLTGASSWMSGCLFFPESGAPCLSNGERAPSVTP